MTITQEQRARRRLGIGSSDAPKILGLDSYAGPADVLMEKLGKVEPDEGGEAAMWGNLLEAGVLRRVSVELGRDVVPGGEPYWRGVLFAHLDGQLDSRQEGNPPVEAKCIFRPSHLAGYDRCKGGVAALPERVTVQVHHAMLCCGAGEAYVAALFIGDDGEQAEPQIYHVPRDDTLCQMLEQTLTEWWDRHVVRGEPLDAVPNRRTLKRMIRAKGSRTVLDPSLVSACLKARELANIAKKAHQEATDRLIAALGQAEIGEDEHGNMLCSYQVVHMTGLIDRERLKEDYPDVYRNVLKQTSYRQLYIPRNALKGRY